MKSSKSGINTFGRERRPSQAIFQYCGESAGLVVLTGCEHAGIVNIVRYARRLTGIDTVAAVVGGFHLSGPAFEPIIKLTVDALAQIGAEAIIPAHCTGWRAAHASPRRCRTPTFPTAWAHRWN
jgi:7,8-dihydropterin-6-yl-methyl-4-(beta-D-ribofuranosyl)aminobenzene 5'-phosphate synthase